MKVSIIIPCFNSSHYTKKCLNALLKNTNTKYKWEIIFSNDASTDDTKEFLNGIGRKDVKVIHADKNGGFSSACNKGAKISIGEYLLFLNSDTEVLSDWLDPMIEILDNYPDVAVCGSKLIYPDQTIQHAGVVFREKNKNERVCPIHAYQGFDKDYPPANVIKEFQAVTGASYLVRKTIFNNLGGFDEGFKNGWEDVDLSLKIRSAGYKIVYQPKSVIIHHESKSEGRFAKESENWSYFSERWSDLLQADEVVCFRNDGNYELANARYHLGQLRLDLSHWFDQGQRYKPGMQTQLLSTEQIFSVENYADNTKNMLLALNNIHSILEAICAERFLARKN